jgi:hypothetical protein
MAFHSVLSSAPHPQTCKIFAVDCAPHLLVLILFLNSDREMVWRTSLASIHVGESDVNACAQNSELGTRLSELAPGLTQDSGVISASETSDLYLDPTNAEVAFKRLAAILHTPVITKPGTEDLAEPRRVTSRIVGRDRHLVREDPK